MSLINHRKPILIVTAGTILVAALVITGFTATQKQAQQKAAEEKSQNVSEDIAGFRETLASPAPFSSLPPDKQTALLDKKAVDFGLPPKASPSPVAVAEACIHDKSRELSVVVRTYDLSLKDKRNELDAAVRDIQDYCYKTYTPEGKMPHDMMPKPMAH